jgi:hypothetical protein
MVSACPHITRDTQPSLKQEGPYPSYITHPGIRASYSHALNYIYSEPQISLKFWPRQQKTEKQPPLFYLSGDAMSRQSNDLHTGLPLPSIAARGKGRVHCSEATKSAECTYRNAITFRDAISYVRKTRIQSNIPSLVFLLLWFYCLRPFLLSIHLYYCHIALLIIATYLLPALSVLAALFIPTRCRKPEG